MKRTLALSDKMGLSEGSPFICEYERILLLQMVFLKEKYICNLENSFVKYRKDRLYISKKKERIEK